MTSFASDNDSLIEELYSSSQQEPQAMVASIPASMFVMSLGLQLDRAAGSQDEFSDSEIDHIETLLNARLILQERFEGDADTLSMLDTSIRSVLNMVVDKINTKFGINFNELALDPEDGMYFQYVHELYVLFFLKRREYAANLLYKFILSCQKSLVDRYRKNISKRNQTVADARRTFQNYDDVVLWANIRTILRDLRDESDTWGLTFTQSVIMLSVETSPLVNLLSARLNDERFGFNYCSFLLSDSNIWNTGADLGDRIIEDAPKKDPATAAAEEEPDAE